MSDEIEKAAALAVDADEAVRGYDDIGAYGVAREASKLLVEWAPIVAAARAWGAAHEAYEAAEGPYLDAIGADHDGPFTAEQQPVATAHGLAEMALHDAEAALGAALGQTEGKEQP